MQLSVVADTEGADSIQERVLAQVTILIVNCSLFNPTPSLSAMIVNHFKMKSSVVSYNLSGMAVRRESSPSPWPRSCCRCPFVLLCTNAAGVTS